MGELANPSYENGADHAKFIGFLSRDIAERMKAQNEERDEHVNRFIPRQIALAARLCDIGNHALPESIWANTGILSETDRAFIRTHPAEGAARLGKHIKDAKAKGVLYLADKIIQSHHERFDGSGYPLGLSGKNIPLVARIVAVADTFMSMTSDRPHRKAFNHEEAVKMIIADSGILFDPAVVSAFVEVADNYRSI